MSPTPDTHRYPYDHLPEGGDRPRGHQARNPDDEDVSLEVLALERMLGLKPPVERSRKR